MQQRSVCVACHSYWFKAVGSRRRWAAGGGTGICDLTEKGADREVNVERTYGYVRVTFISVRRHFLSDPLVAEVFAPPVPRPPPLMGPIGD